eukprot:TRINITY_DN7265_c0_g1_i1.p1 TRINITY_DN7265_c0_g1~~TRINITY_DN7265_c0_g1_i1.p1  ORF type:complete len:161 (-),score=34.99 TRINITY_DN7265_c0_g1_i1:177-638(-)
MSSDMKSFAALISIALLVAFVPHAALGGIHNYCTISTFVSENCTDAFTAVSSGIQTLAPANSSVGGFFLNSTDPTPPQTIQSTHKEVSTINPGHIYFEDQHCQFNPSSTGCNITIYSQARTGLYDFGQDKADIYDIIGASAVTQTSSTIQAGC